MEIGHLCRMANQIAQFYQSTPDRSEALTSVATHLRRFWDPRMRRALLAHVDTAAGKGLDPFVLEALRANRALVEPPASGTVGSV
jgi:formate dehydrogenase subunit delta